jgi:hypothetical protein
MDNVQRQLDRNFFRKQTDGVRHCLYSINSPEASPKKIIIVTSWFEELKQRVPVK